MGKTQILRFEDVWNKIPHKCVVMLEASGLHGDSKGSADPYAKITCGKKEVKTAVYKKTTNPKFNEKEIFFFKPKQDDELQIELRSYETFGKEDFLGTIKISLDTLEKDKVVDGWHDLKARNAKDKVSGKLHLRLYLSSLQETRPLEIETSMAFQYDTYMTFFKTGDLILYDGIGVLPAATKLVSNSQFSSAALVVKLPNKWTMKEELFLVEITRNIDNFLDAFKETASEGVCIFRMFERIHHIHCNSVWYAPLKKPLTESQQQSVCQWVAAVHKGADEFCKTINLLKPHPEILNLCESAVPERLMKTGDFREMFSASLVANALKSGEVPIQHCFFPADLLTDFKFYEKPTLLRIEASLSTESIAEWARPSEPTKDPSRSSGRRVLIPGKSVMGFYPPPSPTRDQVEEPVSQPATPTSVDQEPPSYQVFTTMRTSTPPTSKTSSPSTSFVRPSPLSVKSPNSMMGEISAPSPTVSPAAIPGSPKFQRPPKLGLEGTVQEPSVGHRTDNPSPPVVHKSHLALQLSLSDDEEELESSSEDPSPRQPSSRKSSSPVPPFKEDTGHQPLPPMQESHPMPLLIPEPRPVTPQRKSLPEPIVPQVVVTEASPPPVHIETGRKSSKPIPPPRPAHLPD